MTVLFDDAYYTVAYKESGMLSEGAQDCAKSMPHELMRALSLSTPLHPVHRLDREVSGALLFAKHAEAMAKISDAAFLSQIEKIYIAVTHVPLSDHSGEMQDLLYHDRMKNKTYVVKKKRTGVREARLSYRLRCEAAQKQTSLFFYEVSPHTGRTHQIRVQFAHRKSPLLGDARYGSKEKAPHIGLFCRALTFTHPYTHARIEVTAPLPPLFPFTLIEENAPID